MPGPVGGGRSGGGGGFSGGSHGGFSGGSHGGFSGGSHRPYINTVHRTVGGHNGNGEGNDPNRKNPGCGKGIILIVFLMAIFGGGVSVFVADEIFSHLDSTPVIWDEFYDEMISAEWDEEYDGYYITPVEGVRTKLDESLCKPVAEWYEDNAGLIASGQEEQDVKEALNYFYEWTGVQPYLITADRIDGDTQPEWDMVDSYLTDRYIDLFGEDEGHYIFLYFAHPDASYTFWYIPGLDAMEVMDDNASEILMDYMDMFYYESTTYAEMFQMAFIRTAETIMHVYDHAHPASTVPYSTAPAVLPDSEEVQSVPVFELTTDDADAESDITAVIPEGEPGTVEVSELEEDFESEDIREDDPATDDVSDEEYIEDPEEDFISADMLKYIAIASGAVIGIALLAAYVLHQKKKMKDLEKM